MTRTPPVAIAPIAYSTADCGIGNPRRSGFDTVTAREEEELERRERLYRGDRPPLTLSKRLAILVDDGLATGSTMRAAAVAVKQHGPRIASVIHLAAYFACAEVARPARFLNIILGVALLVTLFAFAAAGVQMFASIACGLALIVLSVPRGRVQGRYGSWNRYII
jgi:hypothetical protein